LYKQKDDSCFIDIFYHSETYLFEPEENHYKKVRKCKNIRFGVYIDEHEPDIYSYDQMHAAI